MILGWYAGKGAAVWALTPGTSSGALHSRFPWHNAHKAAPSLTHIHVHAIEVI